MPNESIRISNSILKQLSEVMNREVDVMKMIGEAMKFYLWAQVQKKSGNEIALVKTVGNKTVVCSLVDIPSDL